MLNHHQFGPLYRSAEVLVIPTWSGPLFSVYSAKTGEFDHVLQVRQRGNGQWDLHVEPPIWIDGTVKGEGASLVVTDQADACLIARCLVNAARNAGRSAVIVGHIPWAERWKYSPVGPPPDYGM